MKKLFFLLFLSSCYQDENSIFFHESKSLPKDYNMCGSVYWLLSKYLFFPDYEFDRSHININIGGENFNLASGFSGSSISHYFNRSDAANEDCYALVDLFTGYKKTRARSDLNFTINTDSILNILEKSKDASLIISQVELKIEHYLPLELEGFSKTIKEWVLPINIDCLSQYKMKPICREEGKKSFYIDPAQKRCKVNLVDHILELPNGKEVSIAISGYMESYQTDILKNKLLIDLEYLGIKYLPL